MEMENWIPLTQYSAEKGVSISTLRRRIKSNAIQYKMEDGRYLLRADEQIKDRRTNGAPLVHQSSDGVRPMMTHAERDDEALREMELRWKALEARVNGLAKKVDYLIEQNSELNMLVKVFEEKMNASV